MKPMNQFYHDIPNGAELDRRCAELGERKREQTVWRDAEEFARWWKGDGR